MKKKLSEEEYKALCARQGLRQLNMFVDLPPEIAAPPADQDTSKMRLEARQEFLMKWGARYGYPVLYIPLPAPCNVPDVLLSGANRVMIPSGRDSWEKTMDHFYREEWAKYAVEECQRLESIHQRQSELHVNDRVRILAGELSGETGYVYAMVPYKPIVQYHVWLDKWSERRNRGGVVCTVEQIQRIEAEA